MIVWEQRGEDTDKNTRRVVIPQYLTSGEARDEEISPNRPAQAYQEEKRKQAISYTADHRAIRFKKPDGFLSLPVILSICDRSPSERMTNSLVERHSDALSRCLSLRMLLHRSCYSLPKRGFL